MLIYYGFTGVILVLSLLVENQEKRRLRKTSPNIDNKKACKKINIIDLLVLFLLISFASLRFGVGTDYYNYYNMYNRVNMQPFSLKNVFQGRTNFREPAFYILNFLLKKVIGYEYAIFWLCAILTYVLIYMGMKKGSKHTAYSLLCFILLGFYTSSFNGMRQWVAVAIVFYGITFLLNQSWHKFIFVVLLASMFHYSALLMFPFILLAYKIKPSFTYLILATLAGILGVYGFNTLLQILDAMTRAIGRYDVYVNVKESGIGLWLQIAFWWIVTFLLVVFKERLRKENTYNDFYLSCLILAIPLMIVGTKNVNLTRLVTYLNVFSVYLLPSFINIFEKRSRPFLYVTITMILTIWFGFNLKFYSDLIPYKTYLGR